jgi:DNA processing protein
MTGERGEGEQGEAACRARCLWLAELASYRSGVVARLVDALGSFDAALTCSAGEVRRVLAKMRSGKTDATAEPSAGQPTDEARFSALLSAGERLSGEPGSACGAVCWCDDLYPAALRGLYDPPPALFVDGCCAPAALAILQEHPVVAIVGSRSPSAYGEEMTAGIARDLARAGVIVVSGMALGLDATAHAAALGEAEGVLAPATIGVLGCGVDVVYPRSNEWLFAAVRRCGLLLSEFTFGVPARAWRFPARNRVIAGLAAAVVIVEGSERSGSLITADYALEIGREVFAVPGEAGRRLSAGPHRLLRQGAALCESANDVLAVLAIGGGDGSGKRGGARPLPAAPPRTTLLSGAAERVAEAVVAELDKGERTIDELALRVGCAGSEVAAVVSALEVEEIVAVAAGRCRLRRGAAPSEIPAQTRSAGAEPRVRR